MNKNFCSEHLNKFFLAMVVCITFLSGTPVFSQMLPFGFWKGTAGGSGGGSNQLAFWTQPYYVGTPNSALFTQPIVAVVDASGNVVTTATDSITLSAYTNSTCTTSIAGLSATTNPVSASSGLATFSGVQYSSTGTIYIKATSGSLTSACSNAVAFQNMPTLDTNVTGSTAGATTVATSAGITTAGTNELLLAQVSTDDSPATGGCSVSSVSGGSLTWVFVESVAADPYRLYTWRALATTALSNQTITATLACSAAATITVSAYKNVDTSGTSGSGAIGISGLITGASATEALSRPYSQLVTALFHSANTTLTAGAGQTIDGQKAVGSISSGLERLTSANHDAGTAVTTSFSPNTGTNYMYYHEVQPPTVIPSAVTLDNNIYTQENGSGSATYNISGVETTEANELLLLAISWRNTTAMSTAPANTGCTGLSAWVSAGTISQSTTVTTQVWRAYATSKLTNCSIAITVPGSAKSTAVLVPFLKANNTGTSGSGAVDVVATNSGSTANPSTAITTLTSNALVVSFLGNANSTLPTASGNFTLQGQATSSGGGGGTSMSTISAEVMNTNTVPAGAVTTKFGLTAIDWAQVSIAVKP